MVLIPKRLISLISVLLLFAIVTGCSSPARLKNTKEITAQDLFQDQLFDTSIAVQPLDQVFALTAEQEAYFKAKFHSTQYRDLSDSQRIYEFLKNHLENFNFHSETLTASESLAQNTGNCMSLALLTKALSKLTHVGISYELARTPPVFQRENNYELSSQHIRAEVYNKTTKNTKQFVKPNDRVKVDYFSTAGSRTLRKVKTKEFYSLFYSNKAAEYMIKGEYDVAYANTKEALSFKSNNLIAVNILGVLYNRMGHQHWAENTYLYGLSLKGDHLELLNNYHKLLIATSRLIEAEQVALVIASYDNPDPFRWLDLADEELAAGNLRKSIRLYEKAIEKADYLHQPYAGIAAANFKLGRIDQAITAMELAMKNAYTLKTINRYQVKYNTLKSMQQTN